MYIITVYRYCNFQVYGFIEAIELIVRKFFNVETQVDTSLKKRVLDAVISSDAVLKHWKIVAGCIPKKYEQYSVCLLHTISMVTSFFDVLVTVDKPLVSQCPALLPPHSLFSSPCKLTAAVRGCLH